MKKIIIAALVVFGFSQAEAQVTFRPGVRAGVNFSHFTEGDYYENDGVYVGDQFYPDRPAEFSSKTDFYVGLYGALRLTKYYTLQPEVNYSRQGSKVEWSSFNEATGSYTNYDRQIDVSYISVSIINKFTFSDKFNIHIGPTFDVITDKSRNNFSNNAYDAYDPYYYDDEYDTESDIDLAFVLGVGFNITKNLGIEARVKKGIIPVYDFWDDNHTNVVFSAGLNYTFDLK